jgi:hypothetical protein
MKTGFTCSRCGQPFATDLDISGRRVRCRACDLVQRIPDIEASPGAPSSYSLAPPPIKPNISDATNPPDFLAPAKKPRSQPVKFEWRKHLRPWVFETSQVQGIGTCLVILSMADVLMTFALLRKSSRFFESNPIASWFLEQWNMAGMVFFKFTLIGGVILLSEIIERNRPGLGRFVLFVGCLGAAYAIFQGGRLYLSTEIIPWAAELE